jgi:YVTN family beta-propeller protein
MTIGLQLKVFLAGRVAVETNGVVIDESHFPGRQGRLLFAYLVAEQGRPVPRDELAQALWGEAPPATWDKALTVIVSKLRSLLADRGIDGPDTLTGAFGCYRLVLPEGTWIDVVVATNAAQEAEEALAAGELEQARAAAAVGASLVQQPFLPGENGAWVEAKRRELADVRGRALSALADSCLRSGDASEAAKWAEQSIALEPFRETGYRRLMEAHVAAGNPAEALGVYERCRRLLADELGTYPSPETESLYRVLLEAPSTQPRVTEVPRPRPPPDEALVHLEQAILRDDAALALPSASETPEESGDALAHPTPPAARRRAGLAAAVAVVVIVGLATIAAVASTKAPNSAASVQGDAVAVVDAVKARLVGSVPVTAPPGAIVYGAGSVWVSFPDSQSVSRISPASSRVVASIPLGIPAQSLAVAASGLWAVGSGPTDPFLTLERINPTFGSVSRARRLPVVVPGDSGSLSSRGATLLVAPRTGLLTRIDARSGRTLGRLDPNAAPSAAALGFGSSWLAYREADLVVRVDSSGAITQIPVGRGPSAIAVGKRSVWVASALDGTVKSIDPATSAVITTIPVGSTPTAIATDGDNVWVASGGDSKLVRIDERSNRVTANVEIGGSPQALAVGGGRVWASVQTPAAAQPSGGTAVVSVPSYVTTLDPAVAFNGGASPVEYATCAMLLNYPDEPGAGGLRLVPDAARALPTVSEDGRSYTFTIRPGMRFSPPSNQPVTAQTFKHTIERSLSPRMSRGGTPGQMFLRDVVGAAAYMAGKARHIAGVEARGDRLTIHLTARAPDLPARLATSVFCAVPTDMPNRPVSGALPSAGPYYVASAKAGRSFVLLRNPNYHGDRPHRLQRIEIVVGASHPVAQIEASKLDYVIGGVPAGESARLERLYGAHGVAGPGRQRYFVNRTPEVDYLILNTRRPLFASARMRRAVAYAVDRTALAATGGAFSTAAAPAQMSLPPGTPGFRDRHVYPLVPDLATARGLAASGRHDAELYCALDGGSRRAAQIIKNNLAAIGIDVHVHCMPGDEFYTRLFRPDEPWDMDIEGYGANYNDPGEFLNRIATDNDFNFTHYHDPRLSRRIRAASRLSGPARAQAYAKLDLTLTRDTVPWINFANAVTQDFFSARIGCQLFQPVWGMDLGALCIRTATDTKRSVP